MKKRWWILIGINIAAITAIAVLASGVVAFVGAPQGVLFIGAVFLVFLDSIYLIVWSQAARWRQAPFWILIAVNLAIITATAVIAISVGTFVDAPLYAVSTGGVIYNI